MKGILKLIKSFGYAFSGIFTCIKSCRNFRIHTVAVTFVLYFSSFYDFDSVTYALLFLVFALVLSAEALNSALEFACDAITDKPCDKIKRAKDAAAAAVLISAFFAVMVAIALFAKPDVIIRVFDYFSQSAIRVFLLVLAILVSGIYIFYEDIFKNGKK